MSAAPEAATRPLRPRPEEAARLAWVDVAKGLCIILVVMMHSTLGTGEAMGGEGFLHTVVAFAKPFRIPDFFLLSGLFLGRVIDRDWRLFADRRIVMVTTHRRENFGGGMEAIARAIVRIADRDDIAIVFPVHPNPNVGAVMDTILADRSNVARIAPLDYPHFVRALGMAHLVLTDSGGVQEEAPALGKPVLVMRETTERPEGISAGTARLVGTDANRIVAETFRLLDDPAEYAAMARAHNPFGDGHAAQRIVELLAAS